MKSISLSVLEDDQGSQSLRGEGCVERKVMRERKPTPWSLMHTGCGVSEWAVGSQLWCFRIGQPPSWGIKTKKKKWSSGVSRQQKTQRSKELEQRKSQSPYSPFWNLPVLKLLDPEPHWKQSLKGWKAGLSWWKSHSAGHVGTVDKSARKIVLGR